MHQIVEIAFADVGGTGGAHTVPRLLPRGRYGRLAEEVAKLVGHPHGMVHLAAMAAASALARGLRSAFVPLCGAGVLQAVAGRLAEKRLRPILNALLDVFFSSGAIPLGRVLDEPLTALLDPSPPAPPPGAWIEGSGLGGTLVTPLTSALFFFILLFSICTSIYLSLPVLKKYVFIIFFTFCRAFMARGCAPRSTAG